MSQFNFTKNFDEMNSYLKERIDRGIEENRKGQATLKFIDKEGNPLENNKVDIKQTRHDFQFGCNIFMLDGFETDRETEMYKDLFKNIFNLAIAPFYWGTLEPEPGKLRFNKDSEYIFRRPAPDLVVEYCEKNNIDIKGHCLLWQMIYPDWLPDDKEKVKPYIVKRFREIAERYKDKINAWDVVNEPLARYHHPEVIFPEDYLFWCYKEADKYFPYNKLMLNEVTKSWFDYNYENTHFYLILENLLLRGARIDGIGLQYHLFGGKDQLRHDHYHKKRYKKE